MAETSYDLTITVKLLTVNRAHRLRKIPYTKSKFHSFLWRLEGQQNIGHFLSLFSVIAIIKWYGTKRQLFSHAKLFFLFLCCTWRQAETGWASKVSPIRESYTVAFEPDSGLRAISSWAVRGGATFWAWDAGFTLGSLCVLSNTCFANLRTVFFLVGDLEAGLFSEDEGNLVCRLSRKGILRQLTIFKTSLLCPSGILARSFSVRYFALAVYIKPLLRNSPAYINKSSSTSLRKSSILFRLSISVKRFSLIFLWFLDRADSERSREQSEPREHRLYRGNFTFGRENFKVWHLKLRRLTSRENMFWACTFTGRCNWR